MTGHRPTPPPSIGTGNDPSGVKRRVYLAYFAVVLLGVLALQRSVPLLDPAIASVADTIVPPTLVFFAVCLLVLWRRPDLLRVVEVAQYAAYFPILLGLLALLLTNATTEAGRLTAVSSFSVWIPMVAVWAFIVFGSRGGPFAAFGFLAATGLVIAGHPTSGQDLGAPAAAFVLQSAVANAIFVVLLFALSRLLERQTASRIAAEVAAEYAIKDVLTGVFTRYALGLRFDQALAVARRTGRRLAVALVDIDDFKRVNDDLGHAAGDEVLRELGARMSAAVRDADTVARLGGDEFVVLAFVEDASHGVRLGERLDALGDEPVRANGLAVDVGMSVGVSVFPDDADSVDGLLAVADAAMYAGKATRKATGKRRAALAEHATPDPSERMDARRQP